jgi:hypothetical protein
VARRLAGRTSPVAALALLVIHPGVARAQEADSKSACVSSYENSQVLRQKGHLLEARDVLAECSRQECPSIVRSDCGTWLEEVDRAIPTVIVQATVDGAEIAAVAVSIDGTLVTARLDGKAIATDPGLHAFRFEASGFPPVEQTVVIREGEHYRALPVAFVSHPAHLPNERPIEMARPTPLAAWILGGVGLAGLAGFLTMGIVGDQQKEKLQSQCAPFCAPSDVDIVQRNYIAADVSLTVAVVSLALGSVVFLSRPEVPVRVSLTPSLRRGFAPALDLSADF